MPYRIQLAREDQRLLLKLLADSCEYKATKKLRSQEKIDQMSEYYLDAANKIFANDIEIRNARSNLFTWIQDQLAHSGQAIWTSRDCQQARDIIAACVSNTYAKYRLRRAAERIFEENNND